MNHADRTKILFRLQRDEVGYPPTDWESLWATPLGSNQFEIDNVPFYIRGISSGDVILARSCRHKFKLT